ncbi:MAG TPA: TolC family protein, partial [Candidatus Polarisedimenticolaceae bacterium]|nr:TolC family protein [Candidatus Polarisedimenticolaceae bacterium]
MTKKALVSLALVLALVAPAMTSRAQTPAGEDDPNAVRMSLAESLTRALENNLDIRIDRLNPEIAQHNVVFQKAVFDPILGANVQHSAVRADSSGTFDDGLGTVTSSSNSGRNSVNTFGASLAQDLGLGPRYSVFGNWSNQSQSPTQNFDTQLGLLTLEDSNPESRGYGAAVSIPLWKGLGRKVNEVGIIVANHNLNISERELRGRVEATLKSVEDAYWNVAALRAAVKVSRQSLQLAKDLYDLNKKKVEVGTLAPIEITQAEAGVASREEGVIVAENSLRDAEDILRRVLAVPPEDSLWTHSIVPSDTPISEPTTIAVEDAIAAGLQNRAEVQNARESVESAKALEYAAHNGTRPDLRLDATLNRSRADDSSTTTYPGSVRPQSTGDFVTRTFPQWTVGLFYTYPI